MVDALGFFNGQSALIHGTFFVPVAASVVPVRAMVIAVVGGSSSGPAVTSAVVLAATIVADDRTVVAAIFGALWGCLESGN